MPGIFYGKIGFEIKASRVVGGEAHGGNLIDHQPRAIGSFVDGRIDGVSTKLRYPKSPCDEGVDHQGSKCQNGNPVLDLCKIAVSFVAAAVSCTCLGLVEGLRAWDQGIGLDVLQTSTLPSREPRPGRQSSGSPWIPRVNPPQGHVGQPHALEEPHQPCLGLVVSLTLHGFRRPTTTLLVGNDELGPGRAGEVFGCFGGLFRRCT